MATSNIISRDDDKVEESNLSRIVGAKATDIGEAIVEIAKRLGISSLKV